MGLQEVSSCFANILGVRRERTFKAVKTFLNVSGLPRCSWQECCRESEAARADLTDNFVFPDAALESFLVVLSRPTAASDAHSSRHTSSLPQRILFPS